ncbi:MAG: dihydropteroate synthase [Alistipes sp.]|nr:dihydropteroate synthase [Alistipes sp.]
MAIVNATPDSFYVSSRTQSHKAVAERVEQAMKEGAAIIDIGGYSSRPDAEDVTTEEEWRRVDMALAAVREVSQEVAISVDTFRAEVIRRAYEKYGEIIVNDITGGYGDAEMLTTVAELQLPYIAMHMRGTPQTMQQQTHYNDVVADVVAELQERLSAMDEAGIDRKRVALDPGFGFAKTLEQNYELLAGLHRLTALEQPLLVGVSRKSMIYKSLGITPDEALAPTQALHWEALRQGATLLRVHDVHEAVQTIKLYEKFEQNDKGQ